MFNAESSLFNGAALGSSGSSSFVRLQSGLICQAVTSGVPLSTKQQLSLRADSQFPAQTTGTLRAYRRLFAATSGTAQATVNLRGNTAVNIGPIRAVWSAQTSGRLYVLRKVSATSTATADTDSAVLRQRTAVHLSLQGRGYATTSGATLRRYSAFAATNSTASMFAFGRVRQGRNLSCSSSCYCTTISSLRMTNGEYAPTDRVLTVPAIDRVFYVSGD